MSFFARGGEPLMAHPSRRKNASRIVWYPGKLTGLLKQQHKNVGQHVYSPGGALVHMVRQAMYQCMSFQKPTRVLRPIPIYNVTTVRALSLDWSAVAELIVNTTRDRMRDFLKSAEAELLFKNTDAAVLQNLATVEWFKPGCSMCLRSDAEEFDDGDEFMAFPCAHVVCKGCYERNATQGHGGDEPPRKRKKAGAGVCPECRASYDAPIELKTIGRTLFERLKGAKEETNRARLIDALQKDIIARLSDPFENMCNPPSVS
jgi:hypothetical protein